MTTIEPATDAVETDRDKIASLIGSFPLHTDDRGPDNSVLHDAFSGDYTERTEAIYILVDDLLAEISRQDEARIHAEQGELEKLRSFAKEATIALTELAGGGSECFSKQVGDIYLADVPFCKERIKDRLRRSHDAMLKIMREANERIHAERKAGEWRDIASAPRDGTRILIWFVHENAKYSKDPIAEGWAAAHEAYWIDHNKGGWTWYGHCGVATLWQPLPTPPSGSEQL